MLRIFHAVLGFVLLAGGTTTLYNASISPHGDALPLSTLLSAEVHCVGGLWLLAGIERERTRPFATAVAVGLFVSSFYCGLVGQCSYGLLGINPWYSVAIYQAVAINLLLFLGRSPGTLTEKCWTMPPSVIGLMLTTILIGIAGAWRTSLVALAGSMLWYIAIFDLFAVTGMMLWRSSADQIEFDSDSPVHFMGLILTAFLVALMGATPRPLAALAGTAMLEGQPLKDAILSFYKIGMPILQARTGSDGQFQLPPILPGTYQVSISEGAPANLPKFRLGDPISSRKRPKPSTQQLSQWSQRPRIAGNLGQEDRVPNQATNEWIGGIVVINECNDSGFIITLNYAGSYGKPSK